MIHNLNVEIIDSNAIANIGTGYYKNIFPKSTYYDKKIFFYTPIPISQGTIWEEAKPNQDTQQYGPFGYVEPHPVNPETGDRTPLPKPRPAQK